MTDEFRRLGRKTRKSEIKSTGELFPKEDDDSRYMRPSSEDDAPLPDLSALDDSSQQDVDFLATLPSGLIAKPIHITPDEQRYPPIAPPKPKAPPKPAPIPIEAVVPAKESHALRYNLITLVALLASGLVLVWFSVVWENPQSMLNPLAPPIQFVQITATFLPATPMSIMASDATSVPTIESLFPFGLSGNVLYTPNNNGRECEWASIAGTVNAQDGSALNGYRVRVTGEGIETTVFSGGALTFGAGGFEFPLGDTPIAKSLDVQLFSPQGAPLSQVFNVQAVAECERNVIILTFREN
jgi:hypothetical protein